MTEQYQFVVRKGPKVGQPFRLLMENISVGRDPMSDIVISDPEISRHHAKVVRHGSGYAIIDRGSTNGTFVDGVRLERGEEKPLIVGQLVSMGSGVILSYELVGTEIGPSMVPSSEEIIQTPATFATDAPAVESFAPPEPAPAPAAPVVPESQPLVPSGENGRSSGRRRLLLIGMTLLILFCLLFALSGYFIWGDPLMRLLGFY